MMALIWGLIILSHLHVTPCWFPYRTQLGKSGSVI